MKFPFFALAIVVLSLSLGLLAHALVPHDDTDNLDNGERSGMVLYTDHGTGCQYLAAGSMPFLTARVLTPRLGTDGKPLCGAPSDYYPPMEE